MSYYLEMKHFLTSLFLTFLVWVGMMAFLFFVTTTYGGIRLAYLPFPSLVTSCGTAYPALLYCMYPIVWWGVVLSMLFVLILFFSMYFFKHLKLWGEIFIIVLIAFTVFASFYTGQVYMQALYDDLNSRLQDNSTSEPVQPVDRSQDNELDTVMKKPSVPMGSGF
jgi:hypothetical protein